MVEHRGRLTRPRHSHAQNSVNAEVKSECLQDQGGDGVVQDEDGKPRWNDHGSDAAWKRSRGDLKGPCGWKVVEDATWPEPDQNETRDGRRRDSVIEKLVETMTVTGDLRGESATARFQCGEMWKYEYDRQNVDKRIGTGAESKHQQLRSVAQELGVARPLSPRERGDD